MRAEPQCYHCHSAATARQRANPPRGSLNVMTKSAPLLDRSPGARAAALALRLRASRRSRAAAGRPSHSTGATRPPADRAGRHRLGPGAATERTAGAGTGRTAPAAHPHRDQLRARRRHRHRQEQGKPVLDLTPEEFSVAEDGKPQKIDTFEVVKIDSTATEIESGPPPRDQERLRRGAAKPAVRTCGCSSFCWTTTTSAAATTCRCASR